jgi:hypothetical protein
MTQGRERQKHRERERERERERDREQERNSLSGKPELGFRNTKVSGRTTNPIGCEPDQSTPSLMRQAVPALL